MGIATAIVKSEKMVSGNVSRNVASIHRNVVKKQTTH
jgi:hypothetical protein